MTDGWPSAGPLAETTRRDQRTGVEQVESRHAGHLVLVGPDGDIASAIGDPARPTFARSAVKPFQAAACLELLEDAAAPRPADHLIAVGWASHRAEPVHQAAVTELLELSGTDPDALTCPPAHPDTDEPTVRRRLYHNCSGKHALFALAGRTIGAAGASLLDPDGAFQARILATLEDVLGPPTAVAVDGCGAPAVAVPLVALARAARRLADDPRFAAVRAAGHAHPLLVGGTGRLESALLSNGVTAKPGAEGVFAAAWTDADDRAWGLALKIEDGAGRAAAAATFGALVALGVVDEDLWSPEPIVGGGRPQGRVRAHRDLRDALADARPDARRRGERPLVP